MGCELFDRMMLFTSTSNNERRAVPVSGIDSLPSLT